MNYDIKELGKTQPAMWLQIDPMADKYPGWSPYNYVFNNPVIIIDPDGKDSIYVNLPQNRSDEGTIELIVNGENVSLNGGNKVLGKGTTHGGMNPLRDPMKIYGNTPTGAAYISSVVDLDPEGTVVDSKGKPIVDSGEYPSSQQKAFGRYFIRLEAISGNFLEAYNSSRSGIGFHGGGTILGKNALDSQQRLVGTQGCLRLTNETAAQIAQRAIINLSQRQIIPVFIK